MTQFILSCLIPSFLISLCVTAAMRSIAPRTGLLDFPAARKVHKKTTPLGGGIGIVCGVLIPLAFAELAAKYLVSHGDVEKSLLPDVTLSPEGVLEHRFQLWWILACGIVLSV